MANPTLHWRMLTPIYVSASTSTAWMDALYTAGTSTTYADGTTRTPGTFATPGTASLPATLGTGSAWTWNYDTATLPDGKGSKTGLYCYAPTTTALNQAVVIGCSSNIAGGVWKQLYADTRTASFLYMGLAKNSGTYTSWNNATTPFTVGDFTGFGMVGSSTNTNYLIMWESEEALAIQIIATSSGTLSAAILGAFIDPLSANTANAETDGRLYGFTTTGGSNVMAATWLSGTAITSAPLLYNANTSTDQHSVTFTPGAGTIVPTSRFGSFAPTYSFTSRNGDLPQIPFQVWNGTQYVGQLRQIFITRDAVNGTAWNVGATPKGYLLGATLQATSDAVLLTY